MSEATRSMNCGFATATKGTRKLREKGLNRDRLAVLRAWLAPCMVGAVRGCYFWSNAWGTESGLLQQGFLKHLLLLLNSMMFGSSCSATLSDVSSLSRNGG